MQELMFKVGYYSIYCEKTKTTTNYIVDNGKILYSSRFKKYIPNPYRDVKSFKSVDEAKKYASKKLKTNTKRKERVLKTLPKSLYLIIMKEESTGKSFVKVGITSKRFIMRRFSKEYGYAGYQLDTILRRIDTKDAEILEEKIKEKLNKKRGIKKFRPLLVNFSGYSECFSYECLTDIISIFDELTKNS